MRIVAIAAAAALMSIGLAASAQVVTEAPPPPGRFTLAPEDDGFLRLDTHSGAVSHCRKDGSGAWTCAPMAEAEQAAVAAEIAALDVRIAALSAQLDALRRDLAWLQQRAGIETQPLAPPAPSPPVEELQMPGVSDADRAELERALGFMEILMRRFSNMVGEMKRAPETQKE